MSEGTLWAFLRFLAYFRCKVSMYLHTCSLHPSQVSHESDSRFTWIQRGAIRDANLVFIDGACVENCKANAAAGYGSISAPTVKQSRAPVGDHQPQTS